MVVGVVEVELLLTSSGYGLCEAIHVIGGHITLDII